MPVTQFPDPLDRYQICTSSTRPSPAYDGLQIHETDTNKNLFYDASRSAWLPPWNTAWGRLDEVTPAGTAFDATSPVQATSSAITVYTNRIYKVEFVFTARTATADTIIEMMVQRDIAGGGYSNIRSSRGTFPLASAVNSSETFAFSDDFVAASDTTYTWRVQTTRITGTASTTTPAYVRLSVYDMGAT